MTIYQQEFIRKLPRFGCIGRYDESKKVLAFFMTASKSDGRTKQNISTDDDLTEEMRDAFYAVQDRARAVREYTDLYELSPRMGIRDVDEYRRFTEYGDTVLAGMHSEQHGFLFTIWKQSADRKSVSHGDYSPDFEYAKEILPAIKPEEKKQGYKQFRVTAYCRVSADSNEQEITD